MKKKIMLFLCFILLSATCFAQEITDWERGIFTEIVEKWHDKVTYSGDFFSVSDSDFKQIFQDVAAKYNVSADRVADIDKRLFTTVSVSKEEFGAFDGLMAGLDALPKGVSVDQINAVHAEIAAKYGISLPRLHEIEYIASVF